VRAGIAIVTAGRRVPVLDHVGLSSRARLPSENSRSSGGRTGGCRGGGGGGGNPTPITGTRDAPVAVGKHTRAQHPSARADIILKYYYIIIIWHSRYIRTAGRRFIWVL